MIRITLFESVIFFIENTSQFVSGLKVLVVTIRTNFFKTRNSVRNVKLQSVIVKLSHS